MTQLTHQPYRAPRNKFMNFLRNLLRSERGDTPTQIMIGAVMAIVIIVPTMTFFVNFLAQTSVTAVDATRSKDLRAWAIDTFETKPWNQVLGDFQTNTIKTGPVSDKFNFTIKYAIDNIDNSGGYVVKLVAPKAGVHDGVCVDPRASKSNVCLYYQYTKVPTLSEGIVPAWNGMNYGQADLQPASGTVSPSLAITGNRIVNIGSFDGCSATTPSQFRVSFKWTSSNGLRPGSIQHLVIGNKLFETVPLSSAVSGNTLWYAVTINKPQPSLCFNAEQVRILIDNGAQGTISDLYVAQLLTVADLHNTSGDAPDANLPHIVSDPAWATDGTTWYFTFQNPLDGAAVSSYQIRGSGTNAQCNTTAQVVPINNSNSGTNTFLRLGTFSSVTDLKSKVCDRYYVTSIGANGYNSAEVSFLANGINKVTSVDSSGDSQTAPTNPTNGSFVYSGSAWYLSVNEANVGTIDHFNVVGDGTNPSCVTTQQSFSPDNTNGNIYSLGTFSTETAMRAAQCSSFKVTAVGTNGKSSETITFASSSMTSAAK